MTLKATEASPASENDTPLTEQTAAPNESVSEDANSAESSDAGIEDAKQDEPKSLRDVVESVVKVQEAPADSSTVEAKAEDAAAPEAKAEGEADDPDANVPFHNHPRFKAVLAERDAYKGGAETFRSITSFMEQNSLSGDEVAEGFEIMGLLKRGDPASLAKAREWFVPRLQSLDEQLGRTLPEDLRNKVEDGLIDEATAKETAQARAEAKLLRDQAETSRQRDEQFQQRTAQVDQQQRNIAAVTQWEAGIKAKDPDYAAKKAGLVETQVRALMQERGKIPANPDEALEYVQTAYERTNELLKQLTPKPKAITPSPSGMSAAARPEPKSLREAVEAALNR